MPTAGLSREALPVLLLMLAAAVVALAWPCGALQLQDAALIDDVIMEAAEECYNGKHRRTGVTVQRRKSEMAEMERRAYEEEALRVAMVGHVRAPSACGSRTTPDELENEYRATL
ncbi:unnamed protein product [Triticum turgidum subsp. durum]|uniref:Uncharacterized protein n=1 Tax=Triticum turgidum subsp. durum TaxID=4567 RepID=A0A9R1P173_TRITD|nr:unnamed protein product [Triticum turgidum subsp. durum]